MAPIVKVLPDPSGESNLGDPFPLVLNLKPESRPSSLLPAPTSNIRVLLPPGGSSCPLQLPEAQGLLVSLNTPLPHQGVGLGACPSTQALLRPSLPGFAGSHGPL